ncbi:MAG: TorF family putative porin [Reyranella sp.]|nr:TorF family putative porin [Reyranella sp.]
MGAVVARFAVAVSVASLVVMAAGTAHADEEKVPEKKKWEAPFGGFYSAALTVVSDYAFGGISQTNRQPAFQPSVGYRTSSLIEGQNLWFYLGAWGSNINFASVGPAIEVDLSAGFKWRTLENKLSFDLGYIRYTFLGVPAELAYNYGEFNFAPAYDFGPAQLGFRIRYSPQSFGDSGRSWSERALLSVPLNFLHVNEDVAMKIYGSVGNQSAERYLRYGIPSSDYWFWQLGFVVSAYGLDITVAYTDTSIDVAGCGNTTNCQGRFLLGISKVF